MALQISPFREFCRALFGQHSDFRIRWKVFFPLLLLHMGALAAFWNFTWPAFIAFLVLWAVTGLLGITVGYHRLLAHRSFETHKLVRLFHLICSSISLQQGPISWVRIHRAHHRHSDTRADPHCQLYGFFFGHMGWSFLSHKEIGRSELARTIPNDLRNDKLILFFETYHYHFFIASLVALAWIGGWPLFLWAGCFRTVFVMHITWSVNSLTHRYGYRNYETIDWSTNYWPIGILAWGEGWHNNHHKFPYSARHGLRWWEVDLSWAWIRILKTLGLAWNIKLPDQKKVPKLPTASNG